MPELGAELSQFGDLGLEFAQANLTFVGMAATMTRLPTSVGAGDGVVTIGKELLLALGANHAAE
jgi:hypothetical protein